MKVKRQRPMLTKRKSGGYDPSIDNPFYLDYRQLGDGLIGHGIVIYQAINKDTGVAYYESPSILSVSQFILAHGRDLD